jgi:pimeloyl-ACP methyl ester carboxylesterase
MFDSRPDSRVVLLAVSLLLVLAGGALGYWGHTAGGEITVKDVQFEGTNGTTMSGHLYVPEGVSAEEPAPGVLAVHGYINTKQVQAPFATEYARRGYVTLAIDQTGHGGSAPPAFANAFGGPDGLAYLHSREIVRNDSVAITGHSMGGWAITAAAGVHPGKYTASLYQGSAPGPLPGQPAVPNGTAPNGSYTYPRNMGVVFSEYDEFHWLMWPGSPAADAVGDTEKMQTMFGTNETVEEDRVYGNVSAGSARQLYTPATTHPGDHISTAAVGDSVDWIQRTVPGGTSMAPSNQVWYWKEVGTFLALVGGILFLFPAGSLLLGRDAFEDTTGDRAEPAAESGLGWYANALLAALLPVVTYYPAMVVGDTMVPATPVFPQQLTNGVAIWALVNTLITAALVGIWHYRRDAEGGALARYGLDRGDGWRSVGEAFGVAAALVGALYLMVLIVDAVFTVDFRIWFVALTPMSTWHVPAFLAYLPIFVLFFVALGVLLHGRLRTRATTASLRRAMGTNTLVVAGGFLLLVAVQYVPLALDNTLLLPQLALYAIVSLSFVPVLGVAAAISTYFYRRTGRVWTGAFVNALLVTWFLVAGTATHAAL